MAKLTVLAIATIATIMTISMHDDVLADGGGYQLTVNIPSYPSGTSIFGISITTANGYTDHANIGLSSVTSWTFNVPTNQGSWVQVCVNSDISSGQNCNTYNITGSDMSVSLSPPSGNSDSYYIYPGNTYYVYPGYRHDWDHGLGGHNYDGDHVYGGHHDSGNIGNGGNQGHWFGGHQNSGNIGNGGNQNSGNIGNGGNQGHWFGGHQNSGNNGFGGHQDSGNHGVAQPADRLHHLSNGAPIDNAESSDDD